MKVIACDDGVVNKLGIGWTVLACVLWDKLSGPLRAGHLPIHVDGLDATSQLIYIVKVLSQNYEVAAVFLDSLSIGGFNVVSPASVYGATGIGVAILYKRKPRWERIYRALRDNFSDYNIRLRIMRLVKETVQINTRKGSLHAIVWGIDVAKAIEIVEEFQISGRIPEPLRFIDLYASALSRLLIL